MKLFKIFAVLTLGTLVSGCAVTDTATRNAVSYPISPGLASTETQQAAAPAAFMSNLQISEIKVVVPETLKVSEANRYYPSGDIVWRGDPIGDRHAQVKAIFEATIQKTAQSVSGEIPTLVGVEVLRFHALTEKARYTTGGVHSIKFRITLRDMRTGLLLAEPHEVKADLDGLGGQVAIEAELIGQTQKVRITDHLAEVVRQELTRPGGHKNAKLGMFQALNKL